MAFHEEGTAVGYSRAAAQPSGACSRGHVLSCSGQVALLIASTLFLNSLPSGTLPLTSEPAIESARPYTKRAGTLVFSSGC